MSEKRFEVVNYTGVPKSVYDSQTDDLYDLNKVVNLLNELNDENKKLKRELHMRKMSATIDLMVKG